MINKQTHHSNEPSVENEEQENLIKEKFTETEVEDLIREGFTKEQIAYVAKEKIKGDKQGRIIGIITDILTWIFPDFK
ncbi:hypothetical protein DWW36_12660 [Erysipelotrichaceae bacterium AF15-26LB]|nr:hypothetical protein HMPREF0983_01121 [Erysipelotrichaceae bacterium 3_1_53]MCR0349206.1 hypothetical protein [[Clostridium] innocuum]RJV86947.1 hypothetical protein DWW36_12660 [Erysipelotrichaceae bacterium AF15-26LB]RJV91636.1 hypothetical protein DWX45_05235 [Erysipelotrichaceae bacterium AF19-24AC]